MVSRDRAVKALLELIEEMAAERQHRWGWKNEVAAELGIHASAVGKLVNGDRDGISLPTIEKIQKRSRRYADKLDAVAPSNVAAPAHAEQVTETRAPRKDSADQAHWLKLALDAWGFEGKRREAVVAMLEAAGPPLQLPTVRTLVDLWRRLEKSEAAATNADAPSAVGKHGEARGGRRLAPAKPAKRLK
jgi:predicted transcriptional regulator